MADFEDLSKTDIDLVDLSEMEPARESLLLRSNCENMSSVSKGLCLKEYEDKMDNLEKENFNLKLRLHFYEEKNGPLPEGTEILHEQLAEVKIQNNNLIKDLEEKKELLMDASRALEIIEENKQSDNEKAERLVNELTRKIEALEAEKDALQQALADTNKSQLGNDTGYADFFGAIDAKEVESQRKVIELSQQVEALQEQLNAKTQEEENSKALTSENAANWAKLKYEYDEMKDQLWAAEAKAKDSQRKLNMFQEVLTERGQDLQFLQDRNDRLFRQNKALHEKLEESAYSRFELTVRTQENQEINEIVENLEKEVREWKDKCSSFECELFDARIKCEESERERKKTVTALKNLVLKTKEDEKKLAELEKSISSAHVTGLGKDEAKKDAEIAALKDQLCKIQKKLQLITTTEIAEKNNEIERLTALMNKMTLERQSLTSGTPRISFDFIMDSFNDLKFQQALEMKKLSQQKIDKLIGELTCVVDSKTEQQIKSLKKEMEVVAEKQKITDDAFANCVELCSFTLNHLQELAQFLSVLVQKQEIRESLSNQSIVEIKNIIGISLNMTQRLSIDGRLSSLPNISNLDVLVQTARASIANIRELKSSVDKSLQLSMQCEKCSETEKKLHDTLAEFEDMRRVNQVLEDEIEEAKKAIESRDEENSRLKEEVEEMHNAEDQLNVLLADYSKTIQKLQVEKLEFENSWRSSEHAATKLREKMEQLTSDLDVNWITKHHHTIEVGKLREEIVNAEAQVAAIRMELDEVRSSATAYTLNTVVENDDKENEAQPLRPVPAERNKNQRRTIEISDDRKMLLLATDPTIAAPAEGVAACRMCPKYQHQVAELKKYLGRAVEKLEKQGEQKAIVDRHIQKQLSKTESFLQQARNNMESIIKTKESK